MQLLSYLTSGNTALGVAQDERFLPATAVDPDGPSTMAALLELGPAGVERLRRATQRVAITTAGERLDTVVLQAPVPRPGKVVAVGRNYRGHVAEEDAKAPESPLLFAKWPSAVVGHGADVRWDPTLTTQVDYEAELGVVIGRTARSVTPAEALDYVLGYTCLNDVSARDLQFADGQWVRGKSLDTFCPIGPIIVTADEIGDPQNLAIKCFLGTELVQDSNTSQMFFGVADIISFCSRAFTLEPGDVIATGTPGGVGIFRSPPRLLGDGDVVTVEIESIGRLVNTCRFEAAGAAQ